MSLTKRDTFVRWLDPMKTLWEDAEGHPHLSVENALRAFNLEDTPENRKAVIKTVKEAILEQVPEAQFMYRSKPDSDDFFHQPVIPTKKTGCDHKFYGTKHCVKCGWSPD